MLLQIICTKSKSAVRLKTKNISKHSLFIIIICFLFGSAFIINTGAFAQGLGKSELPVKDPAQENYPELAFDGVRNMLSIDQILSCIKDSSENGLLFDMSGITILLDGTIIDPNQVYGSIEVGPFPFESKEVDYTYHRFRRFSRIQKGKGSLMVDYLLQPSHNSEDWVSEGQIVARVTLHLETDTIDKKLGIYDTYVFFKKEDSIYIKKPSIIEGPFVNMITSNDPTTIIVSFRTDIPVKAQVIVNHDKIFTDSIPLTRHEIRITGLKPDKKYNYYVQIENMKTKIYSFRSAPLPGKETVCFAYIGDSREGLGGGEYNFMGVNRKTLEKIMNLAFLGGADFFLVGGDLINGYTTVKKDFVNQFYFWKQTVAGFFHERPIYAGMGNHEALVRVYDDGSRYGITLDRWPYDTESSEAVFAQEFVHPLNGPETEDARLPSYKENVYSFQYGLVKVIAFNNNYWVSYNTQKFGGCPEGYIMEDQLDWIKQELKKADNDKTVKYVILFAQEPVFPNGGHIDDAMWYEGNNTVRAYIYNTKTKKLQPEKKGIIEIRNELVKAISRCKKVAAVLGADEHSYSKVLIDKNVPIGHMKKDDKNNNGKLGDEGEEYSCYSDLKYPTWYFSAGDAGAPYYSEEKTPWNSYWKGKSDNQHYYFSSQEHVLIFEADNQKISLTVYNPYAEIIDKIDDLMKVK